MRPIDAKAIERLMEIFVFPTPPLPLVMQSTFTRLESEVVVLSPTILRKELAWSFIERFLAVGIRLY
ncbi:MAG: hypothetical protein VXY89_14295 [SAR324 cluster bacterium]|nr:hypothetical protein [SAR324 cluster bacterium]